MANRAAYLEPHEVEPADLDAWLLDQGFDLSKPIQRQRDNEGWTWYFQNDVNSDDTAP